MYQRRMERHTAAHVAQATQCIIDDASSKFGTLHSSCFGYRLSAVSRLLTTVIRVALGKRVFRCQNIDDHFTCILTCSCQDTVCQGLALMDIWRARAYCSVTSVSTQ